MPATLDYARPFDTPRPPGPAAPFLAATLAFAVTHLCVEWLTYHVLVFKVQVLGPATQPWEINKLGDDFFFSMAIEIAYLIPASVIVLLMQGLQYGIARAKMLPLRRDGWVVGIAIGFGYCWMRWAIWGVKRVNAMDYPESANFAIAMLIAALMGATLVAWRRRWR